MPVGVIAGDAIAPAAGASAGAGAGAAMVMGETGVPSVGDAGNAVRGNGKLSWLGAVAAAC